MGLTSKGIGVFLLWGISFLLFTLALGFLSPETLQGWFSRLYDSPKLRWGLGLLAVAALAGGVLLLRWTVRDVQRRRTIAFPNPDGEVTVSLEAIENLVKQLGMEQEGVQALKASASASRDGILVELKTTLWSSCQIPETTERLQGLIRSHLHDMLGVEGPVTVRVHVGSVLRAPRGSSPSDPQKAFAEKIQS